MENTFDITGLKEGQLALCARIKMDDVYAGSYLFMFSWYHDNTSCKSDIFTVTGMGGEQLYAVSSLSVYNSPMAINGNGNYRCEMQVQFLDSIIYYEVIPFTVTGYGEEAPMATYNLSLSEGLGEPCSPYRQVMFFGAQDSSPPDASGFNCLPTSLTPIVGDALDVSGLVNGQLALAAMVKVEQTLAGPYLTTFTWKRLSDNAVIKQLGITTQGVAGGWVYAYCPLGLAGYTGINSNGNYQCNVTVAYQGNVVWSQSMTIAVTGYYTTLPVAVVALAYYDQSWKPFLAQPAQNQLPANSSAIWIMTELASCITGRVYELELVRPSGAISTSATAAASSVPMQMQVPDTGPGGAEVWTINIYENDVNISTYSYNFTIGGGVPPAAPVFTLGTPAATPQAAQVGDTVKIVIPVTVTNTGGMMAFNIKCYVLESTTGSVLWENTLGAGIGEDGTFNYTFNYPAAQSASNRRDVAVEIIYPVEQGTVAKQDQWGDVFTVVSAGVQRTFIINPGAGGTTTPAPGTYKYDDGATVVLMALPTSGYRFVKWQGNGWESSDNPVAVIVNQDLTVTPIFTLVTVTPAFSLGDPSSNPYQVPPGTPVTITTPVNVTNAPDPVTFQMRVNIYEGSILPGAGTLLTTLTKDITLGNGYWAVTFQYTPPDAGTIDRRDVGVEVWYKGAKVIDGQWDDVFYVTGGAPSAPVFSLGDPSANPYRAPAGQVVITTPVNITNAPSPVQFEVRLNIYEGSVLPGAGTLLTTLTQPVNLPNGYWAVTFTYNSTTGAIDRRDVGVEVWYKGAKVIDGQWDDVFYVTPLNITVTSSSGGITNPAPGIYPVSSGASMTFTALPSSGYQFAGWTGDVSSPYPSITITPISGSISIKANFEPIAVPAFSITTPSAQPHQAPAGPVTITVPVNVTNAPSPVSFEVRILIYEGSVLPTHGSLLDTLSQPVNVGNGYWAIQFNYNSTVGTIDRRDVEVQVWYQGNQVASQEWDDVFYVTQPAVETVIEAVGVSSVQPTSPLGVGDNVYISVMVRHHGAARQATIYATIGKRTVGIFDEILHSSAAVNLPASDLSTDSGPFMVTIPITSAISPGTYSVYAKVVETNTVSPDVIGAVIIAGAVTFGLSTPSAQPYRDLPGPVLISCPIVISNALGPISFQVKCIVYEGSVLPGAGTKLWENTQNVTNDNGYWTVQFNYTSAVTPNSDRRDVAIEVWYQGSKVTDGEWDDIFYVEIATVTLMITSGIGGSTDPSPSTYEHNQGDKVTVAAIADDGFKFKEWELDGVPAGTSPIKTITLDTDHMLKAVFEEIAAPGGGGLSTGAAIALAGGVGVAALLASKAGKGKVKK